ncbi:hypothetical protein BCR42DRAFT_388859 [Absidia repens]|uniref:sterol 3beta-glucosyltransferase n=1 Tax=Absidia repens TaxID=90262 RepID=A0A1X2IRF1_9FUNG|nr:hypothetical protein BCR42DRAFT_388859 [Absidia repens]
MSSSYLSEFIEKEKDCTLDGLVKPLLNHQHITVRSEMSIENTPSIDILEYEEDNNDNQSLLRSSFSLSKHETLVGEYPCYLVRLVTLPGWMYLTDELICFFAPLPGKEEAPRKSGYLTKKNHRALNSRYHFILQFHVLSWYESAESHYQPLGSIELKTATDIRESTTRKLGFKIITPTGNHTFLADSMVSKKDWMDDLRRTMFMAKNDGNSVRIVLPLNKATSITKASAFEFAEYIKVIVSDSQQLQYGTKSMEGDDDYYFAFFTDIDEAYRVIHDQWRKQRNLDDNNDYISINPHDDTVENAIDVDIDQIDAANPITEVFNLADIDDVENNNTSFAASTYLMNAFSDAACSPVLSDYDNNNTFGTAFKSGPIVQLPERDGTTHDGSALFNNITNRLSDDSHASSDNQSALAPCFTLDHSQNVQQPSSTTIGTPTGATPKRLRSGSLKAIKHFATLPFQQLASMEYIPNVKCRSPLTTCQDKSALPSSPTATILQHQQSDTSTPSAITSAKKHFSLPAAPYLLQLVSPIIIHRTGTTDQQGVKKKEDLSSAPMWLCPTLRRQLVMDASSPTSVTEGMGIDDMAEEQYKEFLNDELQKVFPMLGTSATVNAVYRGYVWRMLPYYGRIYFTQDYTCFHANALAGHQKIIIPFDDIISIRVLKSRGYHILHGLGVTTKDMNEEIFFEFMSSELRDSAHALLSMESKKHLNGQVGFSESDSNKEESSVEYMVEGTTEHVIPPFEYNGPPLLSSLSATEQHQSLYDSIKSLTITCLTIGSRGDVQPYIALCKALQTEGGHHCRIASHEEYRSWVESYGVEFKSIGGDPGDLMRLCIENGFLSFSFIKNGYKFFYNWFETLLETSWEACQGTDVLIESPSAMVGVHLAEKLEIPYFRSMPFPWTRTTKFPHPFATFNHTGGRIYNDMTYVMIDMALWAGISRSINRFRRERLDLPPTTLERLKLWRVPYLYSFSPLVQPNPKDWPDYIHCTGYWFLDESEFTAKENWQPPSKLLSFLRQEEDSRPVVYIGFGSIMVSDSESMSRVIVEAVMEANVRAIVCKGWSSRKATSQQQQQKEKAPSSTQVLNDYPGTILHLDSVPHDWLFPLIQGVVHHGGAGTCAAGLRAGLPTVIKPFFGDQRFWGQKVEELGVGVCMPKLTREKLRDHLLTITRDKTMINKAKLLGEAIRQENGTKTAMDCLYRNLGLAKRTKQSLAPPYTPISGMMDQTEKQESPISTDNNGNKTSLSSYAAKLKNLPLFGMDTCGV